MLSMIQVGEETGSLPEILNELSRHYGEQAMLQRKLKSQITMPVFQFGMAIAVIAILILVLGFLPKEQGQPDYDPLGWGLKGATGSIVFLGIIISIIIGGILLWKIVLNNIAFKAKISAIFVNLPMVGAYLKESALGKFSIGLGLTLDSPMSTKKPSGLVWKSLPTMLLFKPANLYSPRLKRPTHCPSIITMQYFPRRISGAN